MAKLKLTTELIDKAADLKRSGLSNRDICMACGITETTWYRWLDKPTSKLHRAFCEAIKKAEADYKAELLKTILATATREKNPQWTAAAWLLERKYPESAPFSLTGLMPPANGFFSRIPLRTPLG